MDAVRPTTLSVFLKARLLEKRLSAYPAKTKGAVT
jgi:hypothetical protein